MTTHGNAYDIDANGDAVLVSSHGQQVMMQWERAYMERCVDALRVTSRDAVLEIGFGLAYSATHIQSYHPQSHTIIECDDAVLERARAFAAERQGVEIVVGTWQRVLSTLGAFDCVFFDDYPLPELEGSENEISATRSRWHAFLDVVLHHVRPGARITGYLARPLDLAREGCVVEMTPMPVAASSSCNYFPHREALVPVITVVDPERAITSTRHLQRERRDRVREQLLVQDVLNEIEPDEANDSLSEPVTVTSVSPETQETDTQSYAGFPSREAYLASLRARRREQLSIT